MLIVGAVALVAAIVVSGRGGRPAEEEAAPPTTSAPLAAPGPEPSAVRGDEEWPNAAFSVVMTDKVSGHIVVVDPRGRALRLPTRSEGTINPLDVPPNLDRPRARRVAFRPPASRGARSLDRARTLVDRRASSRGLGRRHAPRSRRRRRSVRGGVGEPHRDGRRRVHRLRSAHQVQRGAARAGHRGVRRFPTGVAGLVLAERALDRHQVRAGASAVRRRRHRGPGARHRLPASGGERGGRARDGVVESTRTSTCSALAASPSTTRRSARLERSPSRTGPSRGDAVPRRRPPRGRAHRARRGGAVSHARRRSR